MASQHVGFRISRSLLVRVHNPRNRECGCDSDYSRRKLLAERWSTELPQPRSRDRADCRSTPQVSAAGRGEVFDR